MKYVLIGMSLMFIGCAQSSGGGGSASAGLCAAHPIVGSWLSNSGSGDVETFNADCSGRSSYCNSTFTYPNSSLTSGSALITVTSSNGNGACLPVGSNSCSFIINGNALAFTCGGSTSNYTRQ